MTSRIHALVRTLRSRIAYGEDAPALMAETIKTAAASQNTELMPLAASAYSLALWALQGKHCGDGYGFPFDRPLLVFAERLTLLSAFFRTGGSIINQAPGAEQIQLNIVVIVYYIAVLQGFPVFRI